MTATVKCTKAQVRVSERTRLESYLKKELGFDRIGPKARDWKGASYVREIGSFDEDLHESETKVRRGGRQARLDAVRERLEIALVVAHVGGDDELRHEVEHGLLVSGAQARENGEFRILQ